MQSALYVADCPVLTPPGNGRLSTSDVREGTSVDVICNTDYSLVGITPLNCQTGGTWSDPVGACQKGKLLIFLSQYIHGYSHVIVTNVRHPKHK